MTDGLGEIIQNATAQRAAQLQIEAEKNQRSAERKKDKLTPAYNAASSLIKRLDEMRDREGSEFTYTIEEKRNSFYIRTNVISTRLSLPGKIGISVKANGKIAAYGVGFWRAFFSLYDFPLKKVVKTKNGETGPIVNFVAQQAALKGLVK